MNDNPRKEQENTPIETPPKNIPHDPQPAKDPDLEPGEDNPVNPQETPPSSEQ